VSAVAAGERFTVERQMVEVLGVCDRCR